MDIQVEDRQHHYRINRNEMKKKASIILEALGAPEGELSILIVSDDEIAGLNKSYLNRSGPTNVIAFPMREGPFSHINANLLGDVVISPETAAREAEACDLPKGLRLDQLLIHGILHLFGFDHEDNSEKARTMKKKEEELFGLLHSEQAIGGTS